MPVVPEAVPVLDLGVYAPDGQIHLGKPECRLVGLLPVDRQVAQSLPTVPVSRGVGLDELH